MDCREKHCCALEAFNLLRINCGIECFIPLSNTCISSLKWIFVHEIFKRKKRRYTKKMNYDVRYYLPSSWCLLHYHFLCFLGWNAPAIVLHILFSFPMWPCRPKIVNMFQGHEGIGPLISQKNEENKTAYYIYQFFQFVKHLFNVSSYPCSYFANNFLQFVWKKETYQLVFCLFVFFLFRIIDTLKKLCVASGENITIATLASCITNFRFSEFNFFVLLGFQ